MYLFEKLNAFGKIAEYKLSCVVCIFALKILLELLTYVLLDLFVGRSTMRCHLNVMYFVTRVAAMSVPGICVSR